MPNFDLNSDLNFALNFEAVIFDLDGLLIDSERVYMRAWIDGAARVGVEIDLAYYLTIVGLPYQDCLDKLVKDFGPGFPKDDFVAASEEIRLDILADGMALKTGARELLDYLDERGIARGLASSSRREYVEEHLRDLEIDGYFSAVVSRSDVERGKPYPDPYLAAAAALDTAPEACLALEDSRHGIHAAAAAGMPVIMVPDLLPADAELRETCLAIAVDLHEVRGMFEGQRDAG